MKYLRNSTLVLLCIQVREHFSHRVFQKFLVRSSSVHRELFAECGVLSKILSDSFS